MFINFTGFPIFEDFERRFQDFLFLKYPHISKVEIQCHSIEGYLKLDNAPKLDDVAADAFRFTIQRNKENVIAYIIISQPVCNSLNLSEPELLASIAHEVGHIIHYFNSSLIGLNDLIHESKADEVASFLNLSKPLSSVLEKLISSGYYTDYQCSIMRSRIKLLLLGSRDTSTRLS